ncbi:DUF177 domain-containing protein [soil metagenome]|nr:DUF177 domain-containing protein [Trueperaceae bacterium]
MAARRDATLNLASLLRRAPGSVDDADADGELSPIDELLDANGLRLGAPLSWSLHVSNTGGEDDFVVSGDVSGTALLECRRCLTDVPTQVDSSFIYPMVYRPGGADELEMIEDDEQDELLVFSQPEVDFAAFLTQVFAIDLPLTVLCKEDCRGLSVDGVDLNEYPDHVPGDQHDERRSPFDALKDIDL